MEDGSYQRYAKTGELLLQSAADAGCSRAAFVLAYDLFRRDRDREGRALMRKVADSTSDGLKAASFKALAIDAEWRLRDPGLALAYTKSALDIPEISERLRTELEKRCSRLEEKRR